jgi:hypothetical protein
MTMENKSGFHLGLMYTTLRKPKGNETEKKTNYLFLTTWEENVLSKDIRKFLTHYTK